MGQPGRRPPWDEWAELSRRLPAVKDRRVGVERDGGFTSHRAGRLTRSRTFWVVRPHFLRTRWRLGEPAEEALRVRRVGQHGGPGRRSMLGQARVHVVGRQQAEAGVLVLRVVLGEEAVAVARTELDPLPPLI